jgi:hypothetical protein
MDSATIIGLIIAFDLMPGGFCIWLILSFIVAAILYLVLNKRNTVTLKLNFPKN